MWRDISLRSILLLSFGVIIGLGLTIGITDSHFLRQIQDNFLELNNDTVAKMVEFGPFKDRLHMGIIAAYEYVQTGDATTRQRVEEMLQAAEESQRNFTRLAEHSAEEQVLAERLNVVVQDVTNEINRLVALRDGDSSAEAVAAQVVKVRQAQMKAMTTVHRDIDTLMRNEREQALAANQELLTSAIRTNLVLLASIVLVGLSIAIVAVYFYVKLEKKVKEKTRQLEREQRSLEAKVNERTKELQATQAGLEQSVSERTKELQDKVGELERFKKLTVSRELKMVELKKELERQKKSGFSDGAMK